MIARVLFFVFLSSAASAASDSSDFGSTLIAAYGTILVHESGHAATVAALGGDIVAFRPYPTKVTEVASDGSRKERWVAGFVKFNPPVTEDSSTSARNSALISAMGSGANAIGVLLFSPLLPRLSEDGATTLNQYLTMASFDAPVYVLVDLLNLGSAYGDWKTVSKETGLHLGWYLAGTAIVSAALNQHRLWWKREADSMRENSPQMSASFHFSF